MNILSKLGASDGNDHGGPSDMDVPFRREQS